MKLDLHIHSLLYDHDCVIVPDLGGFVAERKSAEANPSKNILYPPSRRVAFNSALKKNDGLLASHVAQEEKTRYEAACEKIKNYSSEVHGSLNSGKRFTVEKVGTLFFDSEKNIQFAPDLTQNFLYESFGLAMVHAQVKYEDPAFFARHDETEKKSGTVRWMKLIPAAAVFALILMIPKIIPRVNTELGSIAPMTEQKTEQVVEQPAPENISVPETNAVVPIAIAEEPLVETGVGGKSSVPEAETNLTQAQPNNYFIIAGCFRIEENATKLEADLKSKGFDAAIIGKNNAGLTMVSAASFSTIEEAKDNLPVFQNEIIAGAWVYKGRFDY